VQIEASRLQENQRILIQLLSHDIREAGYRGCAGNHNTLDNTVNNENTLEYAFHKGIQSFDDVPKPLARVFAGTRPTPVAGTDVLVIGRPVGNAFGVRAKNSDQRVFADVKSVEKQACSGTIDRINGICPGAYLLLSDCHKARMFQVGSP